MASFSLHLPLNIHSYSLLLFLLSTLVYQPAFSTLVQQQPLVLKYHNGALLKGTITVNLVWYGTFTPVQRSIVVDFLQSLNNPHPAPSPSASTWWSTTHKYKGVGSSTIVVGKQVIIEDYSLTKSLKDSDLIHLAARGGSLLSSVNVVLTARDVYVDGFCQRCGTHGSTKGSTRFAYAWVGNSETQCPGQCAWPFHQPIYGPQVPPLVAPNADVGIDGMVINLATVLAGAVTNPYNNGYFQGPAIAPLEAVSACTGAFGSGSYPGYPGKTIVDKATGANYNAYGVNGRKYLLPAIWDPQTSACSTLV